MSLSGFDIMASYLRRFPGGSVVKDLRAMQESQEMQVRSLGQKGPLEERTGNPLQYS